MPLCAVDDRICLGWWGWEGRSELSGLYRVRTVLPGHVGESSSAKSLTCSTAIEHVFVPISWSVALHRHHTSEQKVLSVQTSLKMNIATQGSLVSGIAHTFVTLHEHFNHQIITRL